MPENFHLSVRGGGNQADIRRVAVVVQLLYPVLPYMVAMELTRAGPIAAMNKATACGVTVRLP